MVRTIVPDMLPVIFTSVSDTEMMNAFLLTYSTFTNAQAVLTKLIGRFVLAHNAPNVQTIRLRVCNVLKRWVTDKWYVQLSHEPIQFYW